MKIIRKISGLVVQGRGIGRGLGYPTINIEGKYDLPYGVYAAVVEVRGGKYLGAMHYGPKPTFGVIDPVLEIYLFDNFNEFYGETVSIEVYNKVREIRSFKNLDDLKVQISKDVEEICLLEIQI